MAGNPSPPSVTVEEEALKAGGFTNTGTLRYKSAVVDFANELFRRALQLGEAAKAANLPREVTQTHVHGAASAIASALTAQKRPRWYVPAHVGEYLAFAAAGAGGGHLDKPNGIYAFGIGLTIGVILIVVRLTFAEPRR